MYAQESCWIINNVPLDEFTLQIKYPTHWIYRARKSYYREIVLFSYVGEEEQ